MCLGKISNLILQIKIFFPKHSKLFILKQISAQWYHFLFPINFYYKGLSFLEKQDSPELLKTHFVDFAYPSISMGIPLPIPSVTAHFLNVNIGSYWK